MGGIGVALLDFFSNGPEPRESAQSIRWKVIRLDGPIVKQLGLDIEYGVVISSDAMLEKTQTLLFCPLISGLDKDNQLLAKLPWHVEVKLEERADHARIPFKRAFMSTKIVLPISLNEIDRDGRERGKLAVASRRDASEKLKKWLPLTP